MPVDTRTRRLLAVLAVTTVVAVWINVRNPAPVVPAGTPAAPARTPAAAGSAAPVDVRLEALTAGRPAPGGGGRNPFQFQAEAGPAGAGAGAGNGGAPSEPIFAPPAGPVGPAPIGLKFIGLVEGTGGLRVAVLSDGRSTPFYGQQGDIIDGRYRIVSIGVESIDLEYADGRGRQTIRLTGQ